MNYLRQLFWIDLFCLAMFAGALAAEVYTVGMFLRARAVESWPTTEGVIARSQLDTQFKGVMQHQAQVQYTYEVGGKQYTSDQVRARGASSRHRTDVDAIVQKYPAGSKATVHYNPADPADAYLEAGADVVGYVIIVSPLVFAGLFGWYLVGRIRDLAAGRFLSPDEPASAALPRKEGA